MGLFNYTETSFAPIGVKVSIHGRASVMQSWATHEVNGWCIGPAMEHYIYHKVYASKKKGERIADTIEFFLRMHLCQKQAVSPLKISEVTMGYLKLLNSEQT